MAEHKRVAREFIKHNLSDNVPLKLMFNNQLQFQQRLFPTITNFSLKEKQDYTKENILAILDELSEIMNWFNWKHWKKEFDVTEEHIMELKYECIDIMHFLMNIFICWGGDANEFYSIYIDKIKQNNERQDRGY